MRVFSIVILIALLFGGLLPLAAVAAAPPGDTVWTVQSRPGTEHRVFYRGSEGTDFAQSPITGRIYIVDDARNKLMTSTNGEAWAARDNLPAGNPTAVAVAPDDDLVVAVADNASNRVYISTDGGGVWSTLPALPLAGTTVITDVAVSPARSGTLLGRDYAVALADKTVRSTLAGVYLIGTTTAWTAVAGTNAVADFFHVQFSPGYGGDRILVAASAHAVTGVVGYWLLNTATDAALTGYGPATVVDAVVANDLGSAAAIKKIDITLPGDFDASGEPVAYVSVGSALPVATDDVYRMDGATAVDLDALNAAGASTFLGADSVGYQGTQAAGLLFAGYTSGGAVAVKYNADPVAPSPTWTNTLNPPSGTTFITARPSRDFATTRRVFAFTMGAQSAWSVSDDGGRSFYQLSWIDNGSADDWINIEDMAVTADGSRMWLVTDDAKPNSGYYGVGDLHVWRQTMPPSDTGARRVYTINDSGDGSGTNMAGGTSNQTWIRLNPGWLTSATIYVADLSRNPDAIHISNDGGATWVRRFGPVTADLDTFVVVDRDTVYATQSNNFYKSRNQGWTWEPAVSWDTVATANDMQVTADGTILVSDARVRASTDGGATWDTVGAHGASGNNLMLLPDAGYGDNGLIYTADMTSGAVMRLEVETDTWRRLGEQDTAAAASGNFATGANGTLGLAQSNGALFFQFPRGGAEFDTNCSHWWHLGPFEQRCQPLCRYRE